MKLRHFNVIPITGVALALAATALAQNPRRVPPVQQGGSASGNNTQGGGKLSDADRQFMRNAAEGGMKEVEMGKMAEQQGKSDAVKEFGRRMVTDHSKANTELTAIAQRKGVQLGKAKPKMSKMSGANFDKQYIDSMVKDHEQDLAEFEREASNGSDPEVKAFALRTSKVIEKHLALARADQGKLK